MVMVLLKADINIHVYFPHRSFKHIIDPKVSLPVVF